MTDFRKGNFDCAEIENIRNRVLDREMPVAVIGTNFVLVSGKNMRKTYARRKKNHQGK